MNQRQSPLAAFYIKIHELRLLLKDNGSSNLKRVHLDALQALQNLARAILKAHLLPSDSAAAQLIKGISEKGFNTSTPTNSKLIIQYLGRILVPDDFKAAAQAEVDAAKEYIVPEMQEVAPSTLPFEHINDFQANTDRQEPDAKVVYKLLGGENSAAVKNILHKGIHKNKVDKKDAREAYLKHLQNILRDKSKDFKGPKKNAKDDMITLENFLGADGVKLYYAALAEEQNSKAFRNAVFVRSLQHHEGPEWEGQMILWVAGPSASGKTRGSVAAIKKADEKIMKKKARSNAGNIVVSIDGEIERETSQVRQLTLKVSEMKGYPGVSGLDPSESSIIAMIKQSALKNLIAKAALKTKNLNRKLHLVIPNTFTDFRALLRIGKYRKRPGTVQIFSEVAPAQGREESFRRTTERSGNDRALKNAYGELGPGTPLFMNDLDISHASKPYRPEYFDKGLAGSERAREHYFAVSENPHYIRIINDSAYFKQISENPEAWRECTPADDDPTHELIRMAIRDFDEWAQLPAEDRKGLREWYEEKKQLNGTAPINVEAPSPTASQIEEQTLERKVDHYIDILTMFGIESGLNAFNINNPTQSAIDECMKRKIEFNKFFSTLESQFVGTITTFETDSEIGETTNEKIKTFNTQFSTMRLHWRHIESTLPRTELDAKRPQEAQMIKVPAPKPGVNPARKPLFSAEEMALMRADFVKIKSLLAEINDKLDPFMTQVEQQAARKKAIHPRDTNVRVSDKRGSKFHHSPQRGDDLQPKERPYQPGHKRRSGKEN